MRAAAAVASALVFFGAAGCGAAAGDFELTLQRSPLLDEDPLAGVDALELRLAAAGATTRVARVAVHDRAATKWTIALPAVDDGAQLTLAAIAAGQVVAAGRSAPLARRAHAATIYVGLVNQFVATSEPLPLADARFGATATRLGDGRVLIVGGATGGGPRTPDPATLSSAVTLYDPTSGQYTDVASSLAPRSFHGALATADGGALVFGGLGDAGALADIVRFDAAAGSLTTVGALPAPRYAAAAAPLADGRLLWAGGHGSDGVTPLADALVVSPDGSVATVAMPSPRAFATAVTLADGDVLVSGGVDASDAALADAILFVAAGGHFAALSPGGAARSTLLAPRVGHSATALGDGSALVYGGSSPGPDGDSGALALPELYQPTLGGFVTVGPFNLQPRERHSAVALADGSALLFGGEWSPAVGAQETPVQQLLRAVPRAGSADLLVDFPPPPARADAVAVVLLDGSVFFAGGAVGPSRTLAGGAERLVPCFDDCLLVTP